MCVDQPSKMFIEPYMIPFNQSILFFLRAYIYRINYYFELLKEKLLVQSLSDQNMKHKIAAVTNRKASIHQSKLINIFLDLVSLFISERKRRRIKKPWGLHDS